MTSRPSSSSQRLEKSKAADETTRRKSASKIHLLGVSSSVETGFLKTPPDLSSSASHRSFTTKPKAVLDAENTSSQTVPKSMRQPAKIAPATVAEVKKSTEEKRIALRPASRNLANSFKLGIVADVVHCLLGPPVSGARARGTDLSNPWIEFRPACEQDLSVCIAFITIRISPRL